MDERPSVREANVLVVGGGLIGTAAAQAIAQSGANTAVLTRAPAPSVLGSIDWHYGDINGPQAPALLQGRDAVVYAAGNVVPGTKIESVALALSEEVLPVIVLAEAAAKAGARTFVFISSGGTVYGNAKIVPTDEVTYTAPINIYGVIKVQTEQALLEVGRRTGMTIVILRVANPYGPGQLGTRRLGFIAAAIHSAQSGEPLSIWGDGTTTRDFIFITDVGKAIALAARYEGENVILNVGSGQEVSLVEICSSVEALSGKNIDVEFMEARQVDVPRSTLDIRRAKRVLNWEPLVNLESGISRTLGVTRDSGC
jgi:UDP-glucose 4-epimerase